VRLEAQASGRPGGPVKSARLSNDVESSIERGRDVGRERGMRMGEVLGNIVNQAVSYARPIDYGLGGRSYSTAPAP
jgi:hypothetical protein